MAHLMAYSELIVNTTNGSNLTICLSRIYKGELERLKLNLRTGRMPNGIIQGVDVRYAATYGNPHLRTGLTVHTAKPASTPAPPPYSSVRNSVVLPSGKSIRR